LNIIWEEEGVTSTISILKKLLLDMRSNLDFKMQISIIYQNQTKVPIIMILGIYYASLTHQ